MEKMISALPEYAGQVSVETFETLLHILSVLAVNQIKDNVTCAVCIWPFLHFERELELSLAHFEGLLFQCNREGLIITVVDHANKTIAFDREVQAAENLVNFGNKLRVAFSRIAETKTQGGERTRIF